MMLEDPDYTDSVTKRIRSQHINAEYAVQETEKAIYGDAFQSRRFLYPRPDHRCTGYFKRVISILCGAHPPAPPQTDAPCIIAADDLTPAKRPSSTRR